MTHTRSRLRAEIAALTVTRSVLTTGYRMLYPFLPVIARGLGITLEMAALALTARSVLGFLSPLAGIAADRWGRRAILVVGTLLFLIGGLLIGAWPVLAVYFVGVLLLSAGKIMFDPSVHAYIGDRVPYEQRGASIAIGEMAWSFAYLLGMPLVGWLIAQGGWVAPFPTLGILALLGGLLLWRLLENDMPQSSTTQKSRPNSLRLILRHPAVLAAISVGLLISAGNEVVAVIFGAWLESDFGLQVVALGGASAVIGLAELAGEGGVAIISDRLGKRRSVIYGILLNIAAGLVLPLLGRTQAGALVGLFLFFITFEFALVASLPLITELLPEARGTVMAVNVAGYSAGRALGSLLGPALFGIGLLANSIAAAVLSGAGLLLLVLFIRQQ